MMNKFIYFTMQDKRDFKELENYLKKNKELKGKYITCIKKGVIEVYNAKNKVIDIEEIEIENETSILRLKEYGTKNILVKYGAFNKYKFYFELLIRSGYIVTIFKEEVEVLPLFFKEYNFDKYYKINFKNYSLEEVRVIVSKDNIIYKFNCKDHIKLFKKAAAKEYLIGFLEEERENKEEIIRAAAIKLKKIVSATKELNKD